MSIINFNSKTGEIEIIGSESFIESQFYKVQDLMTKRFGIKKRKTPKKTTAEEVPVLLAGNSDFPKHEEIMIAKVSVTPEKASAAETVIHVTPQELTIKRPPVRKYFNALGKLIRVVDASSKTTEVHEPVRQSQQRISITSLKENFGLSEQQVQVIFRDAERQGKARRNTDGSYVWE